MKKINMTNRLTRFGLVLFASTLLTSNLYSQQGRVGINTQAPTSTLDVRGKSDVTDMTGFQAPRLTRSELTAKGDNLYGSEQKGSIIYITDITGGDNASQRLNINNTGYYYFDGNVWQEFTTGGWKISGNKNTNSDNNFIGTSDAANLVFKVNNQKSGMIDYLNANTTFGYVSMGINPPTSDMQNNSSFGNLALAYLKKGRQNTALGGGAMYTSVTDVEECTAIGQASMPILNNAKKNTSIGARSAGNLLSGNNNLAIGYFTWFPNPNGSNQINIANSIFGINSGESYESAESSIGINIYSPKSTFDINGSFGYRVGIIEDNSSTVDVTYAKSVTILVKTSITLPDPLSCPGRIYNLVYAGGNVIISNSLIDAGVSVTGYILSSTPGSKRVTVQAQSSNWYIIASS